MTFNKIWALITQKENVKFMVLPSIPRQIPSQHTITIENRG